MTDGATLTLGPDHEEEPLDLPLAPARAQEVDTRTSLHAADGAKIEDRKAAELLDPVDWDPLAVANVDDTA